jgi:hypothetical protein
MVTGLFADTETGEIVDIKGQAAQGAERLIEVVWRDVSEDYPNLTPLMALEIAQKMVTAVLGGVVKEHAKILAEPFRPQQVKMDI